jgi:hypothetical protein
MQFPISNVVMRIRMIDDANLFASGKKTHRIILAECGDLALKRKESHTQLSVISGYQLIDLV